MEEKELVKLLLMERDKRTGIYIDGVCLEDWIPLLHKLVGRKFICSGYEKWLSSDDNMKFRIELEELEIGKN